MGKKKHGGKMNKKAQVEDVIEGMKKVERKGEGLLKKIVTWGVLGLLGAGAALGLPRCKDYKASHVESPDHYTETTKPVETTTNEPTRISATYVQDSKNKARVVYNIKNVQDAHLVNQKGEEVFDFLKGKGSKDYRALRSEHGSSFDTPFVDGEASVPSGKYSISGKDANGKSFRVILEQPSEKEMFETTEFSSD